MRVSRAGRPVHHPQHFGAAGLQKTPNKTRGEYEEGDIEPCRVIPCDRCLDDLGCALHWDEAENGEDRLDDQRRTGHGNVERYEQKCCHPQPVIFPIDVKYRDDRAVAFSAGGEGAKRRPKPLQSDQPS